MSDSPFHRERQQLLDEIEQFEVAIIDAYASIDQLAGEFLASVHEQGLTVEKIELVNGCFSAEQHDGQWHLYVSGNKSDTLLWREEELSLAEQAAALASSTVKPTVVLEKAIAEVVDYQLREEVRVIRERHQALRKMVTQAGLSVTKPMSRQVVKQAFAESVEQVFPDSMKQFGHYMPDITPVTNIPGPLSFTGTSTPLPTPPLSTGKTPMPNPSANDDIDQFFADPSPFNNTTGASWSTDKTIWGKPSYGKTQSLTDSIQPTGISSGQPLTGAQTTGDSYTWDDYIYGKQANTSTPQNPVPGLHLHSHYTPESTKPSGEHTNPHLTDESKHIGNAWDDSWDDEYDEDPYFDDEPNIDFGIATEIDNFDY